jgi:trans-2,3-dihydro-3-hydroxyanthranilate isomerase
MRYRYFTADVFTGKTFGGNQLAVLPDARGLDSRRMHQIAREFNYSETTFVLPPELPAHTRRLRIFTPGGEVPFAGHPTVGTAHVLAAIGEIRLTGDETRIVFEEGVGPVAVTIRSQAGRPIFSELSVAKLPEAGPPPPDRAALAAMLSLVEEDLLDGVWAPQGLTCGLPFLYIPLRDRAAVARAKPKSDLLVQTIGDYWTQMVFVFAIGDGSSPPSTTSGEPIRARMFAPTIDVPEDPATGSACAAFGGYLAARDPIREGTRKWVVEQGFEMGRPSILALEVDRDGGRISAVRVGGESVMVCEGTIDVPES